MANRCASSRTRCSRYSASEVRGRITGSSSPGSQTSSSRLASPTSATSSMPSSSSTAWAAATCGAPPSTTTQVRRVGELARPAGRPGRCRQRRRLGVRIGRRRPARRLRPARRGSGRTGGGPPRRSSRRRRRSVAHREPAVLALAGQAVLEHHHAGDHVGALHVADVEALDPQRRVGAARAPPAARPAPATGRSGRDARFSLCCSEGLLGVALDGLHQRPLVAALRHPQRHPAAPRRPTATRPAPRRPRAAPAPGPRAACSRRRHSLVVGRAVELQRRTARPARGSPPSVDRSRPCRRPSRAGRGPGRRARGRPGPRPRARPGRTRRRRRRCRRRARPPASPSPGAARRGRRAAGPPARTPGRALASAICRSSRRIMMVGLAGHEVAEVVDDLRGARPR